MDAGANAEPQQSFADLLRTQRERAGLTQESLAELAGLSAEAVGTLERGTRTRPFPHTVRALATALGATDAELARLLAAVPRRAAPRASAPTPAAGRRADPGPPAARSRFTVPAGLLPSGGTPLVGRDRELAEVLAMLGDPHTRLLTLTGTGGVGKTRLALAAAAELAPAYDGGTVVVALASVGAPDQVLPTVALALGLPPAEGPAASAAVAAHVGDQRLLLLLDNMEHLLDAAPEVGALVAACPALVVLVSSRAPLRVRGEREYPVQPLALPESDDPDTVGASAAGRLFLERAAAASPALVLTPQTAPAIASVCRRLAGIPLALELVAARTRLLSASALLTRLDEALRARGPRDLPARQQTMRATLDWSYDLLHPSEQHLLRLLGVFAGGARLDAVEAVAAATGVRGDVLDLLEQLVEQSLVVVVRDGEAAPRYLLLEPVRQYARSLLAEPELAAAQVAIEQVCLRLVEQAAPHYSLPDQLEWLARVDEDDADIAESLASALAAGRAEVAARTSWALLVHWWLRGRSRRGRATVEQVLTHPLPPELRARALITLASMALAQGDLAACSTAYDEALRLVQGSDDAEAEANGWNGVGLLALAEGRVTDAEAAFHRVLSLADGEAPWQEWMRSLALIWVGTCRMSVGDAAGALAQASRGLALARGRGDRLALYNGLYSLAQTCLAVGDLPQARDYLAEGMELALATGEAGVLAHLLGVLVVVEAAEQRWTRVAVVEGCAQAMHASRRANEHRYHVVDPSLRARALEAAGAALGDAALAEALAVGRGLSAAEAVALARLEDADLVDELV